MNKKYTKVLSLLLAFVMVFAAVAPVANAQAGIIETPSVRFEELGRMPEADRACYSFEFLFRDSKGNAMQRLNGIDPNTLFAISATGRIEDALTTAQFEFVGKGVFRVTPHVAGGMASAMQPNTTYTIFPLQEAKTALESLDRTNDTYDLTDVKVSVTTNANGCVDPAVKVELVVPAAAACWTVRTVEIDKDISFLNAPFEDFEVVDLAKDANGFYVLDQNKDYVAGNRVLFTGRTNRDGWFAGTNAQLDAIAAQIDAGELIGVRLVGSEKVYAVNIWDINDIERYDESLKRVLVDPTVWFTRKPCGEVSVTLFANRLQTVDIPVYAYADRFDNTTIQPVPGAVFGIYKVISTNTSDKIVTEEQPFQTVTTDAQGYGTFTSIDASDFFDTLETLAFPVDNNGMPVPYVVKQISAPDGFYSAGVYYYVYVTELAEGQYGLRVRDNHNKVSTIDFRATAARENRLNFPHFVGNAGKRVAGKDRYATSVEVAKAAYPGGLTAVDGTINVVIANGQNFPDALGGQPMTAAYNAPMLLTPANKLPQVVVDYIKEQGVNNAILLGGTASVSAAIEDELAAMGIMSTRIAGSTRYGTAVAAGNQLIKLLNDGNTTDFLHGFNENSRVFLANGEGFADILTVSAPARQFGNPILLTQKDNLAPETAQALKDWKVKEVVIIGGTGSVSQNVANQVSALGLGIKVNRLEGANRQETAMQVARTYYPQANHVFIASDSIFADALVGSLLAAKKQSPILLVGRDTVDAKVAKYIVDENITEFTIIGGSNTVSNAVARELDRIVLSNR